MLRTFISVIPCSYYEIMRGWKNHSSSLVSKTDIANSKAPNVKMKEIKFPYLRLLSDFFIYALAIGGQTYIYVHMCTYKCADIIYVRSYT